MARNRFPIIFLLYWLFSLGVWYGVYWAQRESTHSLMALGQKIEKTKIDAINALSEVLPSEEKAIFEEISGAYKKSIPLLSLFSASNSLFNFSPQKINEGEMSTTPPQNNNQKSSSIVIGVVYLLGLSFVYFVYSEVLTVLVMLAIPLLIGLFGLNEGGIASSAAGHAATLLWVLLSGLIYLLWQNRSDIEHFKNYRVPILLSLLATFWVTVSDALNYLRTLSLNENPFISLFFLQEGGSLYYIPLFFVSLIYMLLPSGFLHRAMSAYFFLILFFGLHAITNGAGLLHNPGYLAGAILPWVFWALDQKRLAKGGGVLLSYWLSSPVKHNNQTANSKEVRSWFFQSTWLMFAVFTSFVVGFTLNRSALLGGVLGATIVVLGTLILDKRSFLNVLKDTLFVLAGLLLGTILANRDASHLTAHKNMIDTRTGETRAIMFKVGVSALRDPAIFLWGGSSAGLVINNASVTDMDLIQLSALEFHNLKIDGSQKIYFTSKGRNASRTVVYFIPTKKILEVAQTLVFQRLHNAFIDKAVYHGFPFMLFWALYLFLPAVLLLRRKNGLFLSAAFISLFVYYLFWFTTPVGEISAFLLASYSWKKALGTTSYKKSEHEG